MPVRAQWYIPKRVILTRYIGDITREDVIEAGQATATLFIEAQPPIHWMIDVSGITKPYLELGTLRQSIEFINQPTFGWAILYGGNKVLHFIGATLGQLLQVRYRCLDCEVDAFQFLKEHDETLSTSPAENQSR